MSGRYYDPTTGTFLSRDPLNAVTRSAYGYVYGNPLNAVDPSGLCNLGPVRIGFMSNEDVSCRGAGVAQSGQVAANTFTGINSIALAYGI